MSDLAPPEPEPIEPIETEPGLTRAAWAGIAGGAGLSLALVAALSVVGIIAQGFAVTDKTNLFYKMGIAFLRNLDSTPVGIMALLAVVLVVAPTIAGEPAGPRDNRRAAITYALVAAVCVVVVLGTVTGVLTRLHFDKQVSTATRRVLATFVVRSMGPTLVALGVALATLPSRFPRPVTPAPYASPDGGGAEPGPGAGAP
jgi:hypothetical protein